MNKKAVAKHTIAVMKGADWVLAKSVMASAKSPDVIATTPFRVVITPKISLSEPPAPSRCWRWYSVTIQLSKTLYIRVVDIPPIIRPANRIIMLSKRMARHDNEYPMQKAKQPSFRPCLSAREPTKDADIAAARNPVVKRCATVSSGRLCWSLYIVYIYGPCSVSSSLLESAGLGWFHLEPVCAIYQEINGQETFLELPIHGFRSDSSILALLAVVFPISWRHYITLVLGVSKSCNQHHEHEKIVIIETHDSYVEEYIEKMSGSDGITKRAENEESCWEKEDVGTWLCWVSWISYLHHVGS
jgi:hypothetical protein